LYAFGFFFFWSTDKNGIKPSEVNLKGHKGNAICKAFDVSHLKHHGKKYGGTINDAVLALTSMSLKQYLREQNDFETKSINMLVPFSLREIPQTAPQHRINNEFTILCFTLQLHGLFAEAIEQISKQTGALKNSLYPFST
jgi:diacylglycerol O-acyltransferase / wax synthase